MEHQLDDLDQPASVVVGAPSPLVQEILAQLGSRGHHAVSIGGAGFSLDHPDAVEECFAGRAVIVASGSWSMPTSHRVRPSPRH
ncbi:MAG: hypothetical protein R2789_16345 [Microthrixaceae bacterium]